MQGFLKSNYHNQGGIQNNSQKVNRKRKGKKMILLVQSHSFRAVTVRMWEEEMLSISSQNLTPDQTRLTQTI